MVDVGDFSGQGGCLQREWEADQRSTGIRRDYSAEDVIRLRGPVAADHALARCGARRLWELLGREDAVGARGAMTGHQVVQMVQVGPQTVYLSGWPMSGDGDRDAFKLTMAMIEAGAASMLSRTGRRASTVISAPGCSSRPASTSRRSTRPGSRPMWRNVPCLVIARTYAHETSLLTSDADDRDHEFLTGERTAEGLHLVEPSMYARVTRALAYAPYADLLWLETATPNLAEARAFATSSTRSTRASCSPTAARRNSNGLTWTTRRSLSSRRHSRRWATVSSSSRRPGPTGRTIRHPGECATTAASTRQQERAQFAVSAG